MDPKDELHEKDQSFYVCGIFLITTAISVILSVFMPRAARWAGPAWFFNLPAVFCVCLAVVLALVGIAKLAGLTRGGVGAVTHLLFSLNSLVVGLFFYQWVHKPLDISWIITAMILVVLAGVDILILGFMKKRRRPD